MYKLVTHVCISTHSQLPPLISTVSLSPDEASVVAISTDKKMRIFDASSMEMRTSIHHGSGHSMISGTYAPDGRAIACGPKKVTLYDALTGKRGLVFEGHKKEVCVIAYDDPGTSLWTAAWSSSSSKEDSLRHWDASSGTCLWQGLDRASIHALTFSGSGEALFVACNAYLPRVTHVLALDTVTHEELWRHEFPGTTIFSMCRVPGEDVVIVCHGRGQSIDTLTWLSNTSGERVHERDIQPARFMNVDASRDEPLLVGLVNESPASGLRLRAHDISNGDELGAGERVEGTGYGFDLVATREGRVFAGAGGSLVAWDRI